MHHLTRIATSVSLSFLVAACAARAREEPTTLAAPRYVESASSGATGTTATSTGSAGGVASGEVSCGPSRQALEGQSCALGVEACRPVGWTCECTQRQAPNCGGAAMALRLLPPSWTCAPVVATADRGDGCQFAPPADRSTCSPEGATCGYQLDDCGFHSATARCAQGVWAVEHLMRPPPP